MKTMTNQRITLTKAHQATKAGAELIAILSSCLDDGSLQDDEITQLRTWLDSSESSIEIPGIHRLRETISDALEDGVITEDERAEIVALVMRVLPKANRDAITLQRIELECDDIDEAPAQTVQDEAVRRSPLCKRWKLFLANNEAAFAVMGWQSVRLWRAIQIFPDNILAAPTDDSLPPTTISELSFFNIFPSKVTEEAAAILDENYSTSAGNHGVTPKQIEMLSGLNWPFSATSLRHYRHADYVIRWWAEHKGANPAYEDPDSPWSFNKPRNGSSWDSAPATAAQISYLKALGVSQPEKMTKSEASIAIDQRLNSRSSVSNRQMMVLRFWDNLSVAEDGRSAVTEWQNTWYDEDPDRRAAWELWKEENGDRGRQDDPSKVPLGAGWGYLEKVKGVRANSSAGSSARYDSGRSVSSGGISPWFWIFLILGALVVLAAMRLAR